LILVLMGVSGSGKSTLAAELVKRTGWSFAEGDDYHSQANRDKMAAGIALNDKDRQPWLNDLHEVLAGWKSAGVSGILTCSALKASYRQRLTAGLHEVRLVWLDPPREQLEERLAHRAGHYMNPNLLGSQLATLEPPVGADVLHLAGAKTADEAATEVLAWIGF
jgi:gluconokinase